MNSCTLLLFRFLILIFQIPDFRWESCETNVVEEGTVGAAFYSVKTVERSWQGRGCIARHSGRVHFTGCRRGHSVKLVDGGTNCPTTWCNSFAWRKTCVGAVQCRGWDACCAPNPFGFRRASKPGLHPPVKETYKCSYASSTPPNSSHHCVCYFNFRPCWYSVMAGTVSVESSEQFQLLL